MEDKSYTYLFNDMLDKVLQLSDDPSQFAEYLSLQIRELIGARTVIITIINEIGEPEVFSVSPKRRKEWSRQPAVLKLAELSFDFDEIKFLNIENVDEKTTNFLNELLIEKAIAIPLIAGNRVVGSILLMDIMDLFGIEKIKELFARLSGVFDLIIRN
jgi:hypothetical protein